MKPRIGINFTAFWPGFHPEHFRRFFPYAFREIRFLLCRPIPRSFLFGVFETVRALCQSATNPPITRIAPGKFVRVFLTGENFEPDMSSCEFAITFSTLVEHENHLRLPLWVYENRAWGYGPEQLVKRADTDWDKVGAEKSEFCNFVYLHPVEFRDGIFGSSTRTSASNSAGSHSTR